MRPRPQSLTNPSCTSKTFFVKLTSDITTVHATSRDSAMAPRKSKAADRSVPATAWPKGWGTAPQLHDVLTQIARFFDELGYGDARSAIAREAEANGIEVPVIEKGTAAPKHALMQLWRNKSEDSNEDDASQESSDIESGALVDDEAEETSSDGSSGSSGSEGSAKAGRKRKRVLTPPSSEDDDSLSDSDASGSSSSDDSGSSSNSSSDSSDDSRPARKRAKRSKSSSSSNSSSSNSSSSDSSSDSDSSEYYARVPMCICLNTCAYLAF